MALWWAWKTVLQMTCWFRSWKWSREPFFLRSLFLVWPKSTATENSLLYPVAVLSKCSKPSNLAVSLQFLNHHSGSVWWAWSQRPREGRQTRLGGRRGWSAVAWKVSPWEKGRDTWPRWCGKLERRHLGCGWGQHGCLEICFLSLALPGFAQI